ncbi:histone-lysine N-methyltransferase NSD3 isoform X3 [Apteryx rowi]|uniref:histone-lysine N-methyltransferase NSD3 isoform X3 n=1 Tax=Apteryx rowi TaxID=308060 RepID=UPI000E1E2187|nr:histone-lysine N-methyltransferase NSD3 isoform X3 [Apteryx rowi]
MDFSFSFMQGIMGNTIQQPPQLIDSANIRQEDAFDASSDIAEDGGQTPYETALQQGFQYPTPTTEDLPPITNGYPPTINMYEPQAKYQTYSQYPNGSANGFGTVRNFSPPEYYQMENSNARPHEVLEKPSPPQPPPPPPPSVSQTVIPKKTGSPEIKLKITKTIQNGRELFESSLCGDLLNEVQASEYAKAKHEGRKEKRKKSSKHDSSRSEERKSHKIPKLEPEEQNRPNERLSMLSERPREDTLSEETPVQQFLPSLPTQVTHDIKFQVGDLVWSKVGTYPWWPCMVSCDPQLDVHTKINTRGAREYHVQFFSNQPERAWVHEKRVREYKGHKQYEQLLAEAAKQASNHSEKQKIRKPRPQRERAQWDIGIAHAEKALKMTREERIEQYTFIYIDKEPEEVLSKAKKTAASKSEAKKNRRPKPALNTQLEHANAVAASPSNAEVRRQSQRRQSSVEEEEPPPVKIAWKTAAARKSLPASITMHKGTLDLQKCNMSPVVKIEQVFALQNAAGDGKLIDQFVYSTKGVGSKTEISVKGQDKLNSSSNQRNEKATVQNVSSPETTSGSTGSVEKKQQRRSIRTRSESEKSTEVVPKKKIKKEQVEMVPLTAVKTGLQKGASEISDSCKPLKKRSRASTDVELTSSAYRDTSDSDSRGLNDLQGSFGKRSDSPSATADADASDVQSVDSSLSRRGTGTNKKDTVCQICESSGESLVSCEGECCGVFHMECLGLKSIPDEKFVCMECKNGEHTCFSCKLPGKDVKRCSVNTCGKFYHEACVRKFATALFESRGFRCPQHCCTACSVDKDIHKASKGRMVRCFRCPIAYHSGDGCIAAGSLFVSSHILICSNHSKRNHSSSAVNVGFCFVCARGLVVQDHSDPMFSSYAYKSHYLLNESNRAELMKLPMIPPPSSASKKKCEKGGKLLCCESCPASFHPECLNIEMPEGCWNCNDCKAGKKLHYKQIVWVKLGNYRWWPAEICNPRSVPLNIQGLKHDIGDFPVFFFGSHDYYWVHQGRVFPYVEGDKSFAEGQTSINKTFKKALEEAAKRFQELKAQRESKEALEIERNSRKPPPYKHIKGEFVNEYVGELIDEEECRLRIKRAHENSVTNFYMLTVTKDRIIDAGPKGNYSRFMNHSCNPNCETQKWTVNGDIRVGLFALCDIPAGMELTFNYNLDCLGNGRTECHCGAENCSGFLGVRPKTAFATANEEKVKNAKLKQKKRKIKTEQKQMHEDNCFQCGDGGELVMCDKKDCPKAYHLLCLNLTQPPFGKWECPWHQCDICSNPAVSFCEFCPHSFCKDHEKGALVASALDGRFCCSTHDPQSPVAPEYWNKIKCKLESQNPVEEAKE